MDAPDRPDKRPTFLNRRKLLWLASTAGLAATVEACAQKTMADPDGHNPPSPASPSTAAATAPADTSVTAVAPTGPTTSVSPIANATSAPLLCREAWGARPARSGGRPHTITRMTLHHEAVVLGDNRNAPERFRADQRYHQDQLGWVDIAYHVGVDRNGNIYELRSTNIAGDTATDYDTTGHFLVLCEGDFDKEAVSEAQIRGTVQAFAWAARTFNVATSTLLGHRDLADTSCPGANLYAWLSGGDLKRRIDDLLAAGGVDLQPFCGADAVAKVAAIEAGN